MENVTAPVPLDALWLKTSTWTNTSNMAVFALCTIRLYWALQRKPRRLAINALQLTGKAETIPNYKPPNYKPICGGLLGMLVK